jgi:small-conductance mechanosensitive channel
MVIGDVIEFENGILGKVREIKLRTSKVRTRDGIVIFVPNSQLTNNRVINWTNSNVITRFHVSVGVAYGSDTTLVEKILTEVALADEAVNTKISPFVRFLDFGNSSLDFEIHFWSEEVWRIEFVKSRIRFAIDKKFRENRVSIPFPQRDLHLKSSDVNIGHND